MNVKWQGWAIIVLLGVAAFFFGQYLFPFFILAAGIFFIASILSMMMNGAGDEMNGLLFGFFIFFVILSVFSTPM